MNPHRWNHVNFVVPPDRIPRIEGCIATLFPWEKFVSKDYLVGYRLTDDMYDAALGALAGVEGDWGDHVGFMTGSVAEWEERLALARQLETERPDLEVSVVDVLRPGDGRAQTDYLFQAFIRLGLLGPLRNTFEMQARTA